MAGIMDKIGGALHIGGNKTEDKQHAQTGHKTDEHVNYGHKTDEHVKHGEPAKKEGFLEKIKDKVHGEGGEHKAGEGEKKKKKKNKEKKEGHHGGDSSSSDSD